MHPKLHASKVSFYCPLDCADDYIAIYTYRATLGYRFIARMLGGGGVENFSSEIFAEENFSEILFSCSLSFIMSGDIVKRMVKI